MWTKIGKKIAMFWNEGTLVEKLSVGLAVSICVNVIQLLF